MSESTETNSIAPSTERKSWSVLSKVVLALVLIVAGLAVVIAVQPSEFRVERSTTMAAPASTIFTKVNDFHHWEAWSPWLELDPKAKNWFEGPPSGKGAAFHWDGNDEVGAGSMTIIESSPNDLVRIQLDFTRPFEDSSITELSIVPAGDESKVTWSMYGKNNFISKAFCLVMDMDKMIGDKYEEGLASLKSIVESKAQPKDSAEANQESE